MNNIVLAQIIEINKLFYRLAKEDDVTDDSSLSYDPCLILEWTGSKLPFAVQEIRDPFTFVFCIKGQKNKFNLIFLSFIDHFSVKRIILISISFINRSKNPKLLPKVQLSSHAS